MGEHYDYQMQARYDEFEKSMQMIQENETLIVTGVTRSGTSLTMQMLHGGGVPVFGQYPSYEDFDPLGINWGKLHGKAIKLPDIHNWFPPTGNYKVILLKRNCTEQARSMKKFMKAAMMPVNAISINSIEKSIVADMRKIRSWASKQKGGLFEIEFENIINDPLETSKKINAFLGGYCNVMAMASQVVPRETKCLKHMLEPQLIKNRNPYIPNI
jgi:hypothetical protein